MCGRYILKKEKVIQMSERSVRQEKKRLKFTLSPLTILATVVLCIILGFRLYFYLASKAEIISYKVTIKLVTDAGEKSVAAVRRVVWSYEPSIFPEQGGAACLLTTAEAIPFELNDALSFVVLNEGEA